MEIKANKETGMSYCTECAIMPVSFFMMSCSGYDVLVISNFSQKCDKWQINNSE